MDRDGFDFDWSFINWEIIFNGGTGILPVRSVETPEPPSNKFEGATRYSTSSPLAESQCPMGATENFFCLMNRATTI